jgi:NAD(P)-dependent dehydrogenase (short-subunit alcohol dehydrogenase family)
LSVDYGIAGKKAVITGGSRGIGRACAMALASQGVDVCITARRQAQLDETAQQIRDAHGVKVATVSADMSLEEDVKRMVSTAASEMGSIDILINVAASFPYGGSLELSTDDWIGHFNVKTFGYLRTMREVYPIMQRNQWGRIVNIAGGASRVGGGGSAGAVNAAIINMTKAFSLDLAKDRITVNAVHPGGPSDSDREALRIKEIAHEHGITEAEAAARQERNIPPIGRRVVSADPANLVLFLCSMQADCITGETMAIDTAGERNRGVVY